MNKFSILYKYIFHGFVSTIARFITIVADRYLRKCLVRLLVLFNLPPPLTRLAINNGIKLPEENLYN